VVVEFTEGDQLASVALKGRGGQLGVETDLEDALTIGNLEMIIIHTHKRSKRRKATGNLLRSKHFLIHIQTIRQYKEEFGCHGPVFRQKINKYRICNLI